MFDERGNPNPQVVSPFCLGIFPITTHRLFSDKKGVAVFPPTIPAGFYFAVILVQYLNLRFFRICDSIEVEEVVEVAWVSIKYYEVCSWAGFRHSFLDECRKMYGVVFEYLA